MDDNIYLLTVDEVVVYGRTTMSKELKFFTSQIVLFLNKHFGYFTVAFISVMQNYRTKTDINVTESEKRGPLTQFIILQDTEKHENIHTWTKNMFTYHIDRHYISYHLIYNLKRFLCKVTAHLVDTGSSISLRTQFMTLILKRKIHGLLW